jgi:hypothetical protein
MFANMEAIGPGDDKLLGLRRYLITRSLRLQRGSTRI